MAFQAEIGRALVQTSLVKTLETTLRLAHQGFSVGTMGRKLAGAGRRCIEFRSAGQGWHLARDRLKARNGSQKHDAGTAEFSGLREFGCNASCMQNRCILIGVFTADLIGRQTVFVDDMEEETHAAGLRRITASFEVTKP
ncbi:hypothetical protein [Bradyrhizobium sp. Gha]|uniref:hypothetical protein n=1 Tax=Bradyrhizobium sp. Gha TaxID=1855318 RepID=UPI0008E29B70|nr:hypothetical protein [Bradyrhizobium sp. Gha]SFH68936.1 hypothetical protein SAMN05216525_101307 [Bradyrhizobium sp. Gha]